MVPLDGMAHRWARPWRRPTSGRRRDPGLPRAGHGRRRARLAHRLRPSGGLLPVALPVVAARAPAGHRAPIASARCAATPWPSRAVPMPRIGPGPRARCWPISRRARGARPSSPRRPADRRLLPPSCRRRPIPVVAAAHRASGSGSRGGGRARRPWTTAARCSAPGPDAPGWSTSSAPTSTWLVSPTWPTPAEVAAAAGGLVHAYAAPGRVRQPDAACPSGTCWRVPRPAIGAGSTLCSRGPGRPGTARGPRHRGGEQALERAGSPRRCCGPGRVCGRDARAVRRRLGRPGPSA